MKSSLEEILKISDFLNHANLLAFVIGKDDELLHYNKNFMDFLNLRESMLHKNWYENFVPEKIRDSIQSKIKQMTKESKKDNSLFLEYPIWFPENNDYKIIGVNAIPFYDTEQRLSGILHIGFRMETFMNNFKETFQHVNALETIINTIPNPIYYKDVNLVYRGCNDAFAKQIFGLPKKDIIGKKITDLNKHVPYELSQDYLKKDYQVLKDGGSQIYKQQILCADGIRREFISNKSVYKDETGKDAGIVGFMIDISEMTKTQVQLENYIDMIKEDLKKRKQSVEKAQSYQTQLNTKNLPICQNVDIAALYMPSEELGGDYFEIRMIKNKLFIIMADCVGHGLEAAMDSILTKSICDRHIGILEDFYFYTEVFLQRISNDIIDYFKEENFLTLFIGAINLKTLEFYYSNAKGELPFLLRQGKIAQIEKANGVLIGYSKNYQYERKKIQLEPNDQLFFYSDAVKEIQLPDKSIFGIKGIEAFLNHFSNNVDQNMQVTIQQLSQVAEEIPLKDDATVLFFNIQDAFQEKYQFNTYDEFKTVKEKIQEALIQRHYEREELQKLAVALEEMGTNALTHGIKFDKAKKVEISTNIGYEYAEIIVRDEGDGFNHERLPDPTDIKRIKEALKNNDESVFGHGRGVYMAKRIVDKLEYNFEGNEVKFLKYRKPKKTLFLFP